MKAKSLLSPEAINKYRQTFKKRKQQQFEAAENRRLTAKQAAHKAVHNITIRYPSIRRIYLFGSVITPGAFRDSSDIDVGVEGADMALCFDIWRDLEQAAQPWPFDVRPLEAEDPFSERVRQRGELIYDRTHTTA
jgi:predicted nucleotidyltransferase